MDQNDSSPTSNSSPVSGSSPILEGPPDQVETNGGADIQPRPTQQPLSLRALSYVRGLLSKRPQPQEVKPQARLFTPPIVKAFTSLVKKGRNGQIPALDDRSDTLQSAAQFMSSPRNAEFAGRMNPVFVQLLHKTQWPTPQHSPNPGQSYVRRIPSTTFSQVPSATDVFEKLLEEQTREPHTNGVSKLALGFAYLISSSLYPTRPPTNLGAVESRLDLSPLYGRNKEEEQTIRRYDGSGELTPDSFAVAELDSLPSYIQLLLILWNRNHNSIARRLLINNESKKWSPLDSLTSRGSQMLQDDEIYEIARSINCAHFRNIVMEDFVKGLLGLPLVGDSPHLDLLLDYEGCEKGDGHKSSFEFGLWANLISQEDAHVPISLDDEDINRPRKNHAGLRRGSDHRFSDDGIFRSLLDATETVVGSPRARGHPSSSRRSTLEIIEQARKHKVCSLNDFRRSLGLKPFTTFEEWNPNPDISGAAKALYMEIDNLELYPGLQAEKTVPGKGFGFGYTMTHALLVDLITTIRSDRRFTTDYTAAKLTQWGYKDCALEPQNDAYGTMFYKLLTRNLPDLIPSITYILSLLGLSRPLRKNAFPRTTVTTSAALNRNQSSCRGLNNLTDYYGHFLGFDNERLHDQDRYMTLYALFPDAGALSRNAVWFRKKSDQLIQEKMMKNGNAPIDVADVINATYALWACENIYGLKIEPDHEAEVFDKLAALHSYIHRNIDPEIGWSVRSTAMKAKEEFSAQIAKNISIPKDADDTWFDWAQCRIQNRIKYFSRIINEFNGLELKADTAKPFLDRMVKMGRDLNIGQAAENSHLRHLVDMTGKPDYQLHHQLEVQLEQRRLVANVLMVAVLGTVDPAEMCTRAVDFYLDERYSAERSKIIELSGRNDPESNRLIMGYIREAQRISQLRGLFRHAHTTRPITLGSGEVIRVEEGEQIFVDLHAANNHPEDYVQPERVIPGRPAHSISGGLGLHKCPVLDLDDQTMPEIFKAIFRLKGLRRTGDKNSRLNIFSHHVDPQKTDPVYYIDGTEEITTYPKSLVLLYDAESMPEGAGKTPSAAPISRRRRIIKKWKEIMPGGQTREIRERADRFMNVILLCLVLWLIYSTLFFIQAHWPKSRSPSPPQPPPQPKAKPIRAPPKRAEQLVVVAPEQPQVCAKRTVLVPYEAQSFLPDADGVPIPLEYTLDHPKIHRLSIIDIDALDVRLAIYVDDVLRGVTRDFELDKANDCGDNLNLCIKTHSAGGVNVPPGNHTVRVEWAGKEYVEESNAMDWGDKPFRRVMWRRESCD
ncbi:heme peroxidase [Infundibulicybe gibba]|nr:heme peroxidase [Infundibulicybe gibba]